LLFWFSFFRWKVWQASHGRWPVSTPLGCGPYHQRPWREPLTGSHSDSKPPAIWLAPKLIPALQTKSDNSYYKTKLELDKDDGGCAFYIIDVFQNEFRNACQDVIQKLIQKASQDVFLDAFQKVIQKESQEASQEVVQDACQDVFQDAFQMIIREVSQDVGQDVFQKVGLLKNSLGKRNRFRTSGNTFWSWNTGSIVG